MFEYWTFFTRQIEEILNLVCISQTLLLIGILPVLYTSFMPKLTVLCMILEMFLVMSKQSYYLLIV